MNDCLNLVLLVKFRSTRRLIFLNDLSWKVVGILCEDNTLDDLIQVLGSEKYQRQRVWHTQDISDITDIQVQNGQRVI